MPLPDSEIQFIDIEGTVVATGSDQEDSFDLSDRGINEVDGYGMEIFKVEMDFRPADNPAPNIPAAGASNNTVIYLRSITSGTVVAALTDDGVITHRRLAALTATEGVILFDKMNGAVYPTGLLVVARRLYVYFDNNTGATKAVRVRVWFKRRHMAGNLWREAFEVWERA